MSIEGSERKTLAQWLEVNPMGFECENRGTTRDGRRHFLCTLRSGDRAMTVEFHQGSAHTEEPNLEDVIGCLAMNAGGFENAKYFEDWAREYGYETDSRRAYATYEAVQTRTHDMRELLSSDQYQELLWEVER